MSEARPPIRDRRRPARVDWRTPPMSEERIEEFGATLEAIAGSISTYAGGGSYAHRLREMAQEIVENLVPLP